MAEPEHIRRECLFRHALDLYCQDGISIFHFFVYVNESGRQNSSYRASILYTESEAMIVNKSINRAAVFRKILEAYPYADDRYIREKAKHICNCDSALITNISEWISGRPFSEVYIRGKYSLGMVLSIRGYDGTDSDFVEAFLALNDYAVNEINESGLWRARL